jgi:hypothetical protein
MVRNSDYVLLSILYFILYLNSQQRKFALIVVKFDIGDCSFEFYLFFGVNLVYLSIDILPKFNRVLCSLYTAFFDFFLKREVEADYSVLNLHAHLELVAIEELTLAVEDLPLELLLHIAG